MGIPLQVGQTVIVLVIVTVASHLTGRAWPDKRFQHEAVDALLLRSTVAVEAHIVVFVREVNYVLKRFAR